MHINLTRFYDKQVKKIFFSPSCVHKCLVLKETPILVLQIGVSLA